MEETEETERKKWKGGPEWNEEEEEEGKEEEDDEASQG